MIENMLVAEQLERIVSEIEKLPSGKYNNDYAKDYASIVMDMLGDHKALKVQLNYVLCNLQGYKGEQAKIDKQILKEVVKDLERKIKDDK